MSKRGITIGSQFDLFQITDAEGVEHEVFGDYVQYYDGGYVGIVALDRVVATFYQPFAVINSAVVPGPREVVPPSKLYTGPK